LCLVLFSIIADYDYDYDDDYDDDVCEFAGSGMRLRVCVCVWVCGLAVCIGIEVVAFYLKHEVRFQGGFRNCFLGLCWERFGSAA
jgi:hypothetical protein